MEKERNIYGDELQPVINGTGDDALFYADRDGEMVVTAYKVFPGVTLAYYSVHSKNAFTQTASGNYLEINHCREGRIECEYDDCFYYLSSGDLSIKTSENGFRKSFDFPVRHYHGISILIETDSAPDSFSCFLSDVNVRLSDIIRKYCVRDSCYIERSSAYISHIFSEIYSVPQSIRKGYLKVKVLELLLYLTGAESGVSNSAHTSCSAAQVKRAKQMRSYIADNMDEHITIEHLSEKFHISATGVKKIFKSVFGMSVYSYIRTMKIQTAAYLLKNSEKSVADIAFLCGYSNASKFSAAFKDIIGVLPNAYRNENRIMA